MAAATTPTTPVGPGAGPTAVPGAAPTAAPSALTTYQEFFSQAANDPFNKVYKPLLHSHRLNNLAPSAAELYRDAGLSPATYPMAYLTLIEDDGELFYLMVHAPAYYQAQPGILSRCKDKVFAFTGEVVSNTITTVEFPADAFDSPNQAVEENVPADLERALDLLQQNPAERVIGPFQDNDANIKQARSRHYVPLPHRYVRYVFGRQVPIRQGFIDLAAAIKNTGDETECPELTDWLLLSVVRAAAGASPNLATALPRVPFDDTALKQQRRTLLETHLPGLKEARLPSMLGLQQTLVHQVTELVQTQKTGQAEASARETKAKAPKTIDDVFSPVLTRLKHMLQIQATDQCPAVWHSWAAAAKKDDVKVLDTALVQQANGAQTNFFGIYPIPTPDLVTKAKGLKWGGFNTDDFEEGINPFSVVLPSYGGTDAGVTKAAREKVEAYAEVHGGSGATLQDALALKKRTVHIPDTLEKARSHLFALLTLWQLLLPAQHPFLAAYGRFLGQYMQSEAQYNDLLRNLPRSEPKPALFLRAIQIRMVNYWQSMETDPYMPDPPDFGDILKQLRQRSVSWIADLPANYWPSSNQSATPPPVSWNPMFPYGMLPGMVPMTPSGSSGGSTLTPPTMIYPYGGLVPAPAPAPTAPPAGAGAKKTNLQVKSGPIVSELGPYRQSSANLSVAKGIEKAGSDPPPITHNGKTVEMCVAYHVKGKCWEKCPRAADHVPHNADDTAKLAEWCKKAYPPQE